MNEKPPEGAPSDGKADSPAKADDAADPDSSITGAVLGWVRDLRSPKNGDESPRDTLEELIEGREESEVPIDEDERTLLANILELRGRTVHDVMVPRADIVAVPSSAKLADVIGTLTRGGHSRLPIYGESLDDALGMVHIKDVLAWRGKDRDFSAASVQRKILFVAPSMQVLELLLDMRAERSHMALVVDEFGGVDGLVTIEDLVEEIVGEIEDEHDRDEEPSVVTNPDGSFTADARISVEALEKEVGTIATAAERENIDTLGGLVFTFAGRVPIRGELIRHSSGYEFEVLDADPRRIRKLRVAAPETPAPGEGAGAPGVKDEPA